MAIMLGSQRDAQGFLKRFRTAADAGLVIPITWTANNSTLQPLDQYLVAYWKAEDLTDEINSHTLTNNNGVTFTAGKHNNAFTFDAASSQYLSTSDSDDWNLMDTDNNYTISLWFQLATKDPASQCMFIYHIEDANNYWGFNYDDSSDSVSFKSRSGGTVIGEVSGGATIDDTNYHHVVLTKQGDDFTFYLDGSSYLTFSKTASDIFSGDLQLGMGDASWDAYMDGQIDEPAIWKGHCMSASEVSALYNSGTGAFRV